MTEEIYICEECKIDHPQGVNSTEAVRQQLHEARSAKDRQAVLVALIRLAGPCPEWGDLDDGEEIEVQGSAKKPYVLRNTDGVFSCSCPAWQFQKARVDQRTCKHLKKLRGEAREAARIECESARSPHAPLSVRKAPVEGEDGEVYDVVN